MRGSRRWLESLWILSLPLVHSWVSPLSRDRPTLRLWTARSAPEALLSLLHEFHFESRLVTLHRADFPVTAEVFEDGRAQLVQLNEWKSGTKFTTSDGRVLDLGQVTTVFLDGMQEELASTDEQSNRPHNPSFVDLDRLYNQRVGRARAHTLTKKQLNQRIAQVGDTTQDLLRTLWKVGPGYGRLVETTDVCGHVWRPILAQEGGRFARWPCRLVATDTDSLSFINGGWLVTDQSVRAGTEARQFAQRKGMPEANVRILRRLECVAMGEFIEPNENVKVEKDVRSVLKEFGQPLSPEGAKNVLVEVGHWSAGTQWKGRIEPWSPDILQAAADLIQTMQNRDVNEKGRVDLSGYPCVAVDPSNAAFLDDAIGLRPRASTGRRTNPDISKWELLIHISDVSDLYVSDQGGETPASTLRRAAESRGESRYDLPIGPLHLLPPALLEALSLSDRKKSKHRCVTVWVFLDERNGKVVDAGIERTIVSTPKRLSYEQATELMERTSVDGDLRKYQALLLVAERIVGAWQTRRRENSDTAKDRDRRLESRTRSKASDVDDSFERSRGHRLVDDCLTLYSWSTSRIIKKAGAPVPFVPGAEAARGGRTATGPLRRYIDGQSQRQALAVACDFGSPMSKADCAAVAKIANDARNSIPNIRAIRSSKTR